MISKTLKILTLLAFLSIVIGFIVLSVWNVPVTTNTVEKNINVSKLITNKS